MDDQLVRDSSVAVKQGLEMLDSSLDLKSEYTAEYGLPFYILDRFGSDKGKRFIQNWDSSNWGDAPIEFAYNLKYLNILAKKYGYSSDSDKVSPVFGYMQAEQTREGRMANDHGHSLWALADYDSESESMQKGIEYLLKILDNESRYPGSKSTSALALMEVDYDYYGHYIESLIGDVQESINQNSLPNPFDLLSIMRWHNTNVSDYMDTVRAIEESLKETSSIDEVSKYNPELTISTRILDLLAAGNGPEISKYRSEWQMELKEQRSKRKRANVIATLPAARLNERRTDIHDKTLEVIDSANDVLRISTLRIGMLHHEIVQLAKEDSGIELKVLTSTGSSRGPRKKLKSAVLNELIRETEGSVREDDLVHARSAIADESMMVVSSADLTRDQLYDQFNLGIFTRDSLAVSEAVSMFDKMWEEAQPADVTQR